MKNSECFGVCCLLTITLMIGWQAGRYFDQMPIAFLNANQTRTKNVLFPFTQTIKEITPSTFSQTSHSKYNFKTGVHVFRHDLTKWNADDNICDNLPPNLKKATLHTAHGDTPIYVHNPSEDIHVSGSLVRSRTWEPHLLNLMAGHLRKDPELQFMDLGANLGVFSLAMAKFGRQVIAVEPLSINLHRFCASIKAGKLTEKITIVYNALSDKRENVSLGIDRRNVGGTYIVNNKNMNKVKGSSVGGQYKDIVMTAKLDDILKIPGFDFKKVIIKMDVEGYENFVLNGGQIFFDQVDVQAVLMEWMWQRSGNAAKEILAFYAKRGYKPYTPGSNAPLKTSLSHAWPVDVIWRKS
ncbi:uncharacterized protein LOC134718744 [Mytilus trossulus]|uniref:uncharacterized protein LOC134718744 n=1 Tax=Mytilus trossulus TaxID=6551 RepID=UPI0030059F89